MPTLLAPACMLLCCATSKIRDCCKMTGGADGILASLLLVAALCCGSATSSACPCAEPSLCEPIKGVPKNEVFGFVTSMTNWPGYNWTLLTTVALFADMNNSLLCHAHLNGVRVVLSASYNTSQLSDQASVQEWINKNVEAVQSQFADGLNIDIEGELQNTTQQQELLTQLVTDTATALKKVNQNYQVTFDVAWSPDCIDGRCYNHAAIAAAVDFVVIMSYDERSQIFGACTASANSALPTTIVGLHQYLNLGIPPNKVVLGLPWYGYDYPCVSLTDDSVCVIPKVPFRGVNCSDAAGTQRPYNLIRELIRASSAFVQWNASLESPFFNYKATSGEYRQVWYDNTESLSLKYIYAAHVGLRGLAFWNIDSLDYNGSPHDDYLTREMWEAILVFFEV